MRKVKTVSLCIIGTYLFVGLVILLYSFKFSNHKSDVAIILGAGTANGKISKVFAERLNHGIILLNQKRVNNLILTGGIGINQKISDSRAARLYLIAKGVDSTKVFIEEKSKVTFYNLVEAKKIMKNEDFKTALIVSDPLHMLRAMHMCFTIGIDAESSPTQSSMYKSRKAKSDFLFSEVYNYILYVFIGQFRGTN